MSLSNLPSNPYENEGYRLQGIEHHAGDQSAVKVFTRQHGLGWQVGRFFLAFAASLPLVTLFFKSVRVLWQEVSTGIEKKTERVALNTLGMELKKPLTEDSQEKADESGALGQPEPAATDQEKAPLLQPHIHNGEAVTNMLVEALTGHKAPVKQEEGEKDEDFIQRGLYEAELIPLVNSREGRGNEASFLTELRNLIHLHGPAIVRRETDSAEGYHLVLVREVSEDLQRVTIEDPLEGKILMEAAEAEGLTGPIIQVDKNNIV